jgi:hypothetical protein
LKSDISQLLYLGSFERSVIRGAKKALHAREPSLIKQERGGLMEKSENTMKASSIGDRRSRRRSLQGWLIGVLKALIVVLQCVSLASQIWVLPQISGEYAHDDPGHAYLRMPYLIVAVVIIVCFETALVALWQLLRKADRGKVFTDGSFMWVDVIIAASAVATVLTCGLLIHASFVAQVGPLGLLLALAVFLVIEVAFILLLVVMRNLLVTATNQQGELEAVI